MLGHAIPKKEIFIVSPYFGMSSLCLRTRLQRSINSNISFCKIIFKSSTWLANFFSFKDKIPLCLRFNIIYKFTYGRCNATYYGEMCCHLKVRVGEHSGISPLTNTQPLKTICWFVTNQFLLMTWKCLLLVILSSIWKS